MPLYVDGQEMKCFVDGQQMSGYVDGVKMFGVTEPQKQRQYALVSTNGCYIVTDEDANSDFQVILDVVPSNAVACGLFSNNISNQYNIQLFHAYNAMRVHWLAVETPTNVDFNASRTLISFVHNNYYQNDVLLQAFPEIEHAITDPKHKILIGKSDDSRTWIGNIYGAKLFIGGVLKHDFIPVPAGDTQYSTTPAPSNCMWDTVTEKYFENAGTGEYGIEEYGLVGDDFGNDALLFQRFTWFDTGAVTVAEPMEIIAKIRVIKEYKDGDIICLFGTSAQTTTGNIPWIIQLMYNSNNQFRYCYQSAFIKTNPMLNPITYGKDIILRCTNQQYIVNNVPYYSFGSPQQFKIENLNNKIYLGVRYNPAMPPGIVWYYAGYVYGFRILQGGVLVRNFVPVDFGSTKYSSTPAPSVCMWDTVTQQYYENQGTTPFQFITPTPS